MKKLRTDSFVLLAFVVVRVEQDSLPCAFDCLFCVLFPCFCLSQVDFFVVDVFFLRLDQFSQILRDNPLSLGLIARPGGPAVCCHFVFFANFSVFPVLPPAGQLHLRPVQGDLPVMLGRLPVLVICPPMLCLHQGGEWNRWAGRIASCHRLSRRSAMLGWTATEPTLCCRPALPGHHKQSHNTSPPQPRCSKRCSRTGVCVPVPCCCRAVVCCVSPTTCVPKYQPKPNPPPQTKKSEQKYLSPRRFHGGGLRRECVSPTHARLCDFWFVLRRQLRVRRAGGRLGRQPRRRRPAGGVRLRGGLPGDPRRAGQRDQPGGDPGGSGRRFHARRRYRGAA